MLMTLEMRQRDEDIGVHHGAADACGLAVFAAHDRDLDIVRALEPVGDDDVTASGERGIAVEIRGIHVLQRVFAAADVERVAVGEEGLAAALLDEIGDDLGIVGAQERQIAELAEMQLDGDEFAVKIDLRELRFFQQLPELVELADAQTAAEISKKDLGCRHGRFSPFG